MPPKKPDAGDLERAATEVAAVFETLGHEAYAQAVGLRNAVRAGLTPPAALVEGVRVALARALEAAAKESSSPELGIDTGATRATRSTLRGLLKRFETAFGHGPARP
jgi:hypothetical protein